MINILSFTFRSDGLITLKAGHTNQGSYPYLVQHNPDLISRVILEKRRRQLILDTLISGHAA